MATDTWLLKVAEFAIPDNISSLRLAHTHTLSFQMFWNKNILFAVNFSLVNDEIRLFMMYSAQLAVKSFEILFPEFAKSIQKGTKWTLTYTVTDSCKYGTM